MSKVLVVADDLTGAAEMAGIGVEYGFTARIARGPGAGDAEMLVLDTDTRAMSAADAAAKVTTALRQWAAGAHDLTYKKTDSVLRGQVAAEVEAMMGVLARKRAILLPQNPSKGRIIENAEYRINGVPLDQTTFRHDPESPITSAKPDHILSPHDPSRIHCANPTDVMSTTGIIVANGKSPVDVQKWATLVDGQTLPAGGADFFRAMLESRGRRMSAPLTAMPKMDHTLIVCGSASAYSRDTVTQWIEQDQPVCLMPDDLRAGIGGNRAMQEWVSQAWGELAGRKTAILAIRHTGNAGDPVLLRNAMASAVGQLIAQTLASDKSLQLFVEGGATAAAISSALRWDKFDIAGNIAPGVVALRSPAAPRVRMIIKPGTYPWPAAPMESW